MTTKKRGGLGRGIGALIPQTAPGERPVDVFFPARAEGDGAEDTNPAASNLDDAAAAEPSVRMSTDTAAELPPQDQSELREVPGATFTRLNIHDITPNRAQPRKDFDEESLEELSYSIREFGLFQPVVVREIDPRPSEADAARYELIMGERRLRASARAGLTEIPAIIRRAADEHMLRDALLENLHRAQLNPLEEASAYQQLLSDFGITQEELAERIGRSRPRISNTIRLLKLPEPVQLRVAAGVLSAGHARAVLAAGGETPSAEAMQRFADKIVNERLSVREAEAAAAAAAETLPRAKAGKKPRAGGVQVQLDEIAERLGDRFDTRVRLNLGAKKGQLVVEFATVADLRRILEEIGDPGFN